MRFMRQGKLALTLVLVALPITAAAYEVNGVRLGGRELDVKKAYPSAHCKPLEWKSNAADRRCDDAQVSLGGVQARFTAYLKDDAILAYDLRFDQKDLERAKATLAGLWGAPLSETTETFAQKNKPDRKVLKMRWEKGADRAVLSAQLDKKRVGVEVSRGNFPEEIYRIR
ncbi:MAG: hypothetical protein WAO95_19360 [Burkholderiales bacterium]